RHMAYRWLAAFAKMTCAGASTTWPCTVLPPACLFMPSDSKLRALAAPAALTLIVLAALYLVMRIYAAGELLLAGTMLVITALAAWIYISKTTYAYRYLFPGIAAALIFVVFPMVYTIAIGFTNYSSRNLLDFNRAEQYFL